MAALYRPGVSPPSVSPQSRRSVAFSVVLGSEGPPWGGLRYPEREDPERGDGDGDGNEESASGPRDGLDQAARREVEELVAVAVVQPVTAVDELVANAVDDRPQQRHPAGARDELAPLRVGGARQRRLELARE